MKNKKINMMIVVDEINIFQHFHGKLNHWDSKDFPVGLCFITND